MDRSQRIRVRSRHRALAAVSAAFATAVVAGGTAHAQSRDTVTVGIYAPSAPFDGPVERLDFVSKLASHVASAAGASKGVGRAYSSATEFNAAVKRGDIQYAVIDGPYSAARGNPYKVLATAERGGATSATWQLVTSTSAKTVLDLRGKRISLPRIGSRNSAFLTNVLLGGELSESFFGAKVWSPDALSSLAAVKVGRADAAFVPSGIAVPSGMRRVFTTTRVSWPVFVALPSATDSRNAAVATAVASFSGGSVFSGFSKSGSDARSLARRFSRRNKRGPMAVPTPRLGVRDLMTGRTFAIERPAFE